MNTNENIYLDFVILHSSHVTISNDFSLHQDLSHSVPSENIPELCKAL